MKREVKLRAATVFASLILALLLVEVTLRVIGFVPTLGYREMFVSRAGQEDAAIWPYKLQSGYKGLYAGGRVLVGDDANRVIQPAEPVREPIKRTVVLLGDSVVFGQGVNDNETLASRLQDGLTHRGEPVLVKNIAAPGYTSWNEYGALKEYFAGHKATDVVLIYVPNDPTLDDDQMKLDSGGFAIQSDSLGHRLSRWLYGHFYTTAIVAESIKRSIARPCDPAAQAQAELVPADAALARSMDALVAAQALCEKHKASFSVGVYRDVLAFDAPGIWSDYEERINRELDSRNIAHFPIRSHIDHLSARSARVSWSDPHPSREATRWAAEDILGFLLHGDPERQSKTQPQEIDAGAGKLSP